MEMEELLSRVEELLKPVSVETSRPGPSRVDFIVEPDKLVEAVTILTKAKWGYLLAITGLDKPAPAPAEGEKPGENHIEVLYHFGEAAAICAVRVTLPYSKLVIPTVCDVIPAATLYERELMEMYGIKIEGTPNTDKLLLPDDWPAGVYPLRKEFTGLAKPAKGEGE